MGFHCDYATFQGLLGVLGRLKSGCLSTPTSFVGIVLYAIPPARAGRSQSTPLGPSGARAGVMPPHGTLRRVRPSSLDLRRGCRLRHDLFDFGQWARIEEGIAV